MNPSLVIRKVSDTDLPLLQKMSKEIFIETYGKFNTVENMNNYLAHDLSLETLQAEWLDPKSTFYFALQNQLPVGYLKLNFWTNKEPFTTSTTVEIERIYLYLAQQRKDIGNRLLQFSKQFAQARNAEFLWLGVWEKNLKAIHFYEKNGFSPCGSHSFKLGNDIQNDLLYFLEIQ